MLKNNYIIALIFAALFQSCTLDNDTIIDSSLPPVVSRISVSPTQISVDKIPPIFSPEDIVDTTIIVSIAVSDNNKDVEELLFDVVSPSGVVLAAMVPLYDNGTHNDTTANDGIYTSTTRISFKKKEVGTFIVRINTKDASGFNVLSLTTISVINPLLKLPQLSALTLLDTTFIPSGSDSVFMFVTVKATDPQGPSDIKSIIATIFTLEGEPYKSVSLFDDGSSTPVQPYGITSGDVNAGDSIYTARISFSKKYVTDYFVSVIAKDFDEASSNILSKQFSVRNQNNGAPVIFGIEMQDSVIVPFGNDTNFVKVAITADDPEGQDDIFAVYFTSMREDSSIVGTYRMYDDGSLETHNIFNGYTAVSGDDFANDALFTVTIPIVSGTVTNTYREFIFQARDRGGKVSTTLSKRIYLK
jgi:hypothetical protein